MLFIEKQELFKDMATNNKLELTWIGKNDAHAPIEPRILIENKEYSYGTVEKGILPNGKPWNGNMLIHGDNLLALKALEQDYSGAVKCIYIDPPYNISVQNPNYDDNLEHSEWLNLMYMRLYLLYNLLSTDGLLWVQIDDTNFAYLKVLCDEIFGVNNFVSSICVKMSTVSGVKTTHKYKTIIKEKEYILVYAKNITNIHLKPQYVPLSSIDSEFQYYLEKHNSNDSDKWEVKKLKDVIKEHGIKDSSSSEYKDFISSHSEYIWRRAFIRNEYKELSQHNPDKIFHIKNEDAEHYYYRGREMFFLSDKINMCYTEDGYKKAISNLLGDIWLDINTGKLFNEGGVEFRNSKKPEFLVSRIIEMSSDRGDLILDSFLGSGTTAAVAQKMGRRYIGIELGEHAYTHCVPRLKMVTDGTDQGGISKAQNWKGGGGFKFYELAPSLLKEDNHGRLVINKEYNPDMLAGAMAKLEGFTYSSSEDVYWKQGYSSEADYIYTTTQFMTVEMLASISEQLSEGETLLICCSNFQKECKNQFSNITIKKIPQVLLGRCEFNHDDYSLNIIDMPQMEEFKEYEEYDAFEPDEPSSQEDNNSDFETLNLFEQ